MKKTSSSRLQARPITRVTLLSIDGSTGNIYDGIIPTVDASIGGDFGQNHGLG